MNAHTPQYATPDGAAINLTIEHLSLGWIPFTASADDIEAMGADLYVRAVAGEFGSISDYDGPSAEEMLTDAMRVERDARLAQLDAIVGNPLRWAELTPAQQTELATYRQALLDVPQQSGFPTAINWPVLPDVENN